MSHCDDNNSESLLLKRYKENMIAHVPTVAPGETEDAPFVFSPRISDGSCRRGSRLRRRRRKLIRNVRSFFCCLAPEAIGTRGVAENGGLNGSSPAVYPSDDGAEFIIGEASQDDIGKKTLVLDLDETLVHSSFNRVDRPDHMLAVEIDGKLVDVYVQKRPGLDAFLHHVCQKFEVVIFTASLSKYADPLLDLLDPEGRVRWRLFREACSTHRGMYVKDLCRLGRDLSQTIIVDNSPLSYIFQPGNALPISTYLGDSVNDRGLFSLLPILDELEEAADVRESIKGLLGEGNAILTAPGENVADIENFTTNVPLVQS